MDGGRVPAATYRLQFNSGFTFRDAKELVPYLHRLGISDIYASPIFQARARSTHGYDVIDPARLSRELGTERDFDVLVNELKHYGMGLVLDIVPNHMAASTDNPWWRDVLEHGPTSSYAGFFDIQWQRDEGTQADQLVLPILGRPLEEALTAGELVLTLDDQGFNFRYYDRRLPLEVKSHGLILRECLSVCEEDLNPEDISSLRRLARRMVRLAPWRATSRRGAAARRRAAASIKQELAQLAASSRTVRAALRRTVEGFNSTSEMPESSLNRLLGQQPYRPAHWRTGRLNLNYRRFFDINDLVGMRVELPRVFDSTHSLVLKLARDGDLTGVRVDHIDGLRDPAAYLRRLRRRLGPACYLVVEKILARDESLPGDWPVQGATGYEFLNALNGLFVDPGGLERLQELYREYTGAWEPFDEVVYQKKKLVIRELFPAEMDGLVSQLVSLATERENPGGLHQEQIREALLEVSACLPVYRTYLGGGLQSAEDIARLDRAVAEASQRAPGLDRRALEFLRETVMLRDPAPVAGAGNVAQRQFVARWQQFTGPVMAKGVEDTALYCYVPLLSLNEVGSDPGHGDTSVEDFHRICRQRQSHRPQSMSATATHDTKRSEDMRARLNVLSVVPDLWQGHLARWTEYNRDKKKWLAGMPVPSPQEEWFLYQTLPGAWPLSEDDVPGFTSRVKEYIVKAAREAKVHTNWIEPDAGYEDALKGFVDSILAVSSQNRFLPDLLTFQQQLADWGFINSLAQTVVKLTAPGVPDTYQGTEFWDFSLADPDNRRPVDFGMNQKVLADLQAHNDLPALLEELLEDWPDGRIKLYVTQACLSLRRKNPELFRRGEYLPLAAQGPNRNHAFAFARHFGSTWVLVAAPLRATGLAGHAQPHIGAPGWQDDVLILPDGAPSRWINHFTDAPVSTLGDPGRLQLSDVFSRFPVAVLVSAPVADSAQNSIVAAV